jgi:hypothetical protein
MNRSELADDSNDLPTRNVAEYVRQLAAAHNVTYKRSTLENWGDAVGRALGDNSHTDDTDGLLIRLKQRNVLSSEQFTCLLINHHRELRRD